MSPRSVHGFQPEPGDRFPFVPFDAMRVATERRYLVKGLIPSRGLVIVWGPPKCGKSFFVTDLALHVALGWTYRGRRVQQGAVLYVAAEGQAGVHDRMAAFRQRFLPEDHDPVPFYALPTSLDLVKDCGELVAAIFEQMPDRVPSVIILDTVNRTLAGSESSDEDMAAYLRAAAILEERFACAVILVHHCGHNGDRPRGHSSITASADAQIRVQKTLGGCFTATVECAKDMAEGEEVAGKLEIVTVGTDEDGDDITSCVVVEAKAIAHQDTGPKLTRNQQTLYSILHTAGAAGLPQDEWSTRAKAEGLGIKRHADLYDTRMALKGKGLVHAYGDRWYVSGDARA